MKLKLVIVDFEIPSRVKRMALRFGLPAVILGAAAGVAYAGVPNTFMAGETLKAADLNANFSALDARITTLEGNVVGPRFGSAFVNGDGTIFTESGNIPNAPGGTQPLLITRTQTGGYNVQWSASQFPNGAVAFVSPSLTGTFEAFKITGLLEQPAASGLSGVYVETSATSGGALADEPFAVLVMGK